MNNRRQLKKVISRICGNVLAEAVAASLYNGVNLENAEALITSIMYINSDFLKRVSHVEPGMKPKKYFNTLIQDFDRQIADVVDRVANLS